jgi:hypothetical protein
MRPKKTDYSELYVPADTEFLINNLDPDRKTIVLSLPKPPDLKLIDGWGEHPDNQFFKRFKTPPKLLTIEREVLRELQDIQKNNRQETVTGYKIIDRFWDKIEEERDDLENEIDFIRKIWYFRLYGYWFFNDGKPTYITGRHFMFLNFFYQPDIDKNDGYPEYRDRHRREFLFREYLRHTTETFAKRDEKGWALPDEDGTYQMIDMGSRVSYGDLEGKNRRNGSTIMAISDMEESSERGFGVYSTIISKDGDSTEEAYNLKLMPAWVNRPYFLKPVWQGSSQPTQIKYFPPKNYYTCEALMSIIDYTVSAGETKKDGSKFNGDLVMDEEGKTQNANVLQRWDINKNALALGDGTRILGYSTHITTVEDINASGLAFLDMMELSDFYQRGDNGQTISGLMAHLYPAYDGLENFIDRFGMSVIDTPTERQCRLRPDAIFASIKKGAKQYQQEKRDDFLKQGTPAAMQSYRAYVKKYPWKTSELYISTISDMGFDYEILDTRIMELRKMKSLGKMPYKIGNFYREGDPLEGNVYWRTEENGKFELSMELVPDETNKKRKTLVWDATKGQMVNAWEPVIKSRFTAGVDPFRFKNSRDMSANKQSDGGIAVLWHDFSIPDKSKNRKFVVSYRFRPATLEEFCEDCIKVCEYFGALCYPENNLTGVYEHFIKRGRGGYLKYDVDSATGRPKDTPGYYAGTSTINDGLVEVKDYISFNGATENHLSFLEEARSMRSVDDLTNNDRFAAHLASLLGARSSYGKISDRLNTQTIDLGKVGFLQKHRI